MGRTSARPSSLFPLHSSLFPNFPTQKEEAPRRVLPPAFLFFPSLILYHMISKSGIFVRKIGLFFPRFFREFSAFFPRFFRECFQ